VKFVVAEVERGVDGLEGLKVDVYLALLPLIGDHRSAIDDEAVFGAFAVKLETLLGGGDSSEDGEAVDAGFDVGGSAVFVGKHLVDTGDLVSGGNYEGDHGGSISTCGLKVFN